MGERADFSGAKYDGDFSLTLEQAQRRKREYVAEQVGIEPGNRVLDVGCGWGAPLDFIRRCGGVGVGVTLSSAQLAACLRHGLDVHLLDGRRLERERFGTFDALTSLGAFEHFCSPEDYRAGRQDEVYESFFQRIAGLLPEGGRMDLQTMVYGRKMVPPVDTLAALDSLPPRWLTSADFRLAFASGVSANKICFEARVTRPLPADLREARRVNEPRGAPSRRLRRVPDGPCEACPSRAGGRCGSCRCAPHRCGWRHCAGRLRRDRDRCAAGRRSDAPRCGPAAIRA